MSKRIFLRLNQYYLALGRRHLSLSAIGAAEIRTGRSGHRQPGNGTDRSTRIHRGREISSARTNRRTSSNKTATISRLSKTLPEGNPVKPSMNVD